MAAVQLSPFRTLMLLALSAQLLMSLIIADSGDVFVHELPPEWHAWKYEHGKSYGTFDEEMWRHAVWQTNMKLINKHNEEEESHGFTLKMNHLGDLVSESSASPEGMS